MPSIRLSVTDRDTISHAVKRGRAVINIETADGLYVTLTAATEDVLASIAARVELARADLHRAQVLEAFGEDRAS